MPDTPQLSPTEIAALQRRLQIYDHQPNDISDLRKMLIHAKDLILEQEELLARLTTAATVGAVVLKVWRNELTPQTFTKGMIVRLTHPHATMTIGETGEITSSLDSLGFIEVDFDLVGSTRIRLVKSGNRGTVRMLELADRQLDSNNIYNYTYGTRVRVISGPAAGREGTIMTPEFDGEGEVRVILDNPIPNLRPFFYVGFPLMLEPVQWSYGRALVSLDGKVLEVECPKDLAIHPGDLAKLHAETMQVVDVAEAMSSGAIMTVVRVVDDTFVEVSSLSEAKLVLNTRADIGTLKEGDRVVLDASGQIVMKNLGSPVVGFKVTDRINVRWTDIAGLDEPKELLHEAIVLPWTERELYSFYNKKPIAGVLLSGPPGCGKTLLAKAAVTEVRELHGGQEGEDAFIYVKGPEILTKMVGDSEQIIRSLFTRGKRHKQRYGYPAIMFIDEGDAIFAKRGTGISSDVNNTIVPAFLIEMGGLEDSDVIVIIATNRPDILDPAIARDKRLDRKIVVGRPTAEIAPAYFKIYLKDVPLCNGYTVDQLAELGAEELFSPKRVLYGIRLGDGSQHMLTIGHLASGAMIANIVDHATSFAMRRDRKSGHMNGLRRDDLIAAMDKIVEENRGLDHTEAIMEMLHGTPHPVTDITSHGFIQANAA
ncbi:MAG: Proteasome-associated ATPase [Candidatus Parcubacteria bacterium]|jgi:proteasome-associated ATPase